MICGKLPSPLNIPESKVELLMSTPARNFQSLSEESKALKGVLLRCETGEEAPIIVFVSKMFSIDRRSLPECRPRMLTEEEIALRRLQARLKNEKMVDNI